MDGGFLVSVKDFHSWFLVWLCSSFVPLHLLGGALGEAQGVGDAVQLFPLVDGVFQCFAGVLFSDHAFREASVFSFQLFSAVLSFDRSYLSHILFSGFPSSGVLYRCCLSRVEHGFPVKVPWRLHLCDSLLCQWVFWPNVHVVVIESFDYFHDVFELICCGGCLFFQVAHANATQSRSCCPIVCSSSSSIFCLSRAKSLSGSSGSRPMSRTPAWFLGNAWLLSRGENVTSLRAET